MFQCSNDKSFTLIELMVSLGLLVTVIMVSLSIYVKVIGTKEKTIGQINIQSDGQYIIGLMVKDVRFGTIDYDNYGVLGSCGPIAANGLVDTLCLVDIESSKIIRYKSDLTASGDCEPNRCVLQRCENETACSYPDDYKSITMGDVSLERLDFYINPTINPFTAGSTIYVQPHVTVVLKLKSLIEKIGEKQMVIQQTIPQRQSYRK